MPPPAAPADQTLKLPGQAALCAWAAFDPAWYLHAYPAVRDRLPELTPAALLRFYLDTGQQLGHSPNRCFDEAWYRTAYPDVAAALGRGPSSGFDHYCRGAHRTHAPHWLFDEQLYRRRNPDLTDAVLDAAGMTNGYDHYLRHGDREQRIGHLFFDPLCYLAELDAAAREAATAGPFRAYLRRIEAGGDETRTSLYFDPAWYLARYPAVAEAIASGAWRCALHHYLANDAPTAFDPLPEFSEADYLARYPDAAAAVEKGTLRHGYRHFLTHGATERRSPGPAMDLRYYADHAAVRAALRNGTAPDPFTHYLAGGKAQGLPAVPPPEERISEGQAKTLFRRKARALLPLFGRWPLDFTCAGAPALTVVMVVHDRIALTLQALGSLRGSFSGAIELVVVDSGSTDETAFLARYVRGATLLRHEQNIGFLRGGNMGMLHAIADAVLLLNNDVELAPGAVDAALARLRSDSAIGAVGGKVIRTHGRLQEAGCIVWGDGSTSGYLRDVSPLVPEANFVRDVDFCSAVFLLLRRSAVEAAGGFDDAFAPAYFEDVDLCLRLSAAGLRVVYDPTVVVYHLEYGSLGSRLEAETSMARNLQVFRGKHAALLATRPPPGRKAELEARSTGPRRTRVLFIEDYVPLRRLGSGNVRSNDILGQMAALGYQVTVFPINAGEFEPEAVFADIPDSVEVMYDRMLSDLPGFLAGRRDYYDVIWIARTHNLDRVRDAIERATNKPRLILDTEAIATHRAVQQAGLSGATVSTISASDLRMEFANAAICEQVVAVNEQEAAALRNLGLPRVSVIGHMRDLNPTPQPFEARAGLLFVGAIHQMDSPNYDSLCWFVGEVLPLIERSLQWETRLTVVGYLGEKVSLDRFRNHTRVALRGAVADAQPLYNSHRVFIAPTRYAAGAPYKVYEAASFGLPVVATELLRRQMGWEHDVELLSADGADARRFADLVVALYRDIDLWLRLREGALKRLRAENNREHYTSALRNILEYPVRKESET
jgi:O-antigen biosynthesis protein